MKYKLTIPALVILIAIASACSSKAGRENRSGESTAAAERASVPVRVLKLEKTKIARTIDYTSTVLPYEEVNVAPSTPGRIEKIYVETGDRISRGDKLFLMDRTQLYQLQLQQSSLEKDLSRMDTLLRTGSARQQAYDQLKTQYDVLRTNVDFMEQNTILRAPFNGVVTGRYFEDGEMFSGTPTTPTGRAAVVTVMQINPLKLRVGISEQYYPLIRTGMKASVTADVYPGETFSGTIFRVAPTISPETRSFIAEIEVPNRSGLLKPGMFVRVSMDLGEVETFVVPASTVLLQEGTNIRYVFMAENGRAKRVEVLIGKRFDDMLEIISENIREGDFLISEGQARLINDDRIETVN